jgi:hypothetical protein
MTAEDNTFDDRVLSRARQLWQAAGSPKGKESAYRDQAQEAEEKLAKHKDDKAVEIAEIDSFPASDPPAHSGITGPGTPA